MFRRIASIYRNNIFSSSVRFGSGDVGHLVLPGKQTPSVEADIVNYGSAGVYFIAYNQHGFILNSGTRIIGPCAAFPRNAMCWNVRDANDINEDSLSLFFLLEPKLEFLVIGKGETSVQVDYPRILSMCNKRNLGVEVLPTQAAVGTFNFLNSEGRYVAAALIPPRRLDIYDPADKQASRLLVAEEERTTQDLLEAEQKAQELKLLIDSSTKPIEVVRSPLLGSGPQKTDETN